MTTLQKERQTKNVLWVSFGKVCSLGSLLLASILVARATDPTSFGYYSVVISLTLLVEAFVGAPLDNAAVRFHSLQPYNRDRVRTILKYILKLKLFIAAGLLVMLLLFLNPVTERIFDSSAPPVILLIGLANTVTLLAIRSTASALQIAGCFSAYSRLDSYQGLFRISFTIALFAIGSSSVAAYLCAQGLGTIGAYALSFRNKQNHFLRAPPVEEKDRKTIYSYIGATSALVILGAITGRADLPVLSILSDSDGVGQYSVAAQLALAGTLLASYVAVVYQPKVVQMANNKQLTAAINVNLLVALGLTCVCLPIAHLVSPVIIPWMFGDAFQNSAALFNILLIGICADFVTMPLLLAYAIQTIPRQLLLAESVLTIGFIVSILAIDNMSPTSMAWTVTIIRILKMMIYYILVKRKLQTIEPVLT